MFQHKIIYFLTFFVVSGKLKKTDEQGETEVGTKLLDYLFLHLNLTKVSRFWFRIETFQGKFLKGFDISLHVYFLLSATVYDQELAKLLTVAQYTRKYSSSGPGLILGYIR